MEAAAPPPVEFTEEYVKEHRKILKERKSCGFIGGLGMEDDEQFSERAESICKM